MNPDLVSTLRMVRHVEQSPAALPIEMAFGSQYERGEEIGHGGMGVVLSARQPAIRRDVAMKVMLDANDREGTIRFIEEAQITGQLQHPNIVPVHDLAMDDLGRPFYTMKWVRGTTLQEVLSAMVKGDAETIKSYPLAVLLTIFQKVCDGVAFAHSRGVIHRDLKPANIMLGDYGEVLVMDWGLAKKLKADGEKTTSDATVQIDSPAPLAANSSSFDGTLQGVVMGTPQYMSPEQARGETATMDVRSDIFTLGTILVQLLTLKPAFEGKDTETVLEKVRTGQHHLDTITPQPHCPDGELPQSLAAVARKALQLNPEQRYPCIEDLQRDIAAYQGGFATSAEGAGWWRQFTLLVRRHRGASIVAGSGLLLLMVVSAGFTARVVGERNRAEQALADLKRTAPKLLALAESESLAQHFDSALEKTDAALALDSGLAAGWWKRAWTLVALERFSDAIQAVREAKKKDPQHQAFTAIIPLIEALEKAGDAPYPPTLITPVTEFLETVGAQGEALHLTVYQKLGTLERYALVQKRLTELKVSLDGAQNSEDGLIILNCNRSPITSLDHVRGLPLDVIYMDARHDWDAAPLQGMHLVSLRAKNSGIKDISPLRGMALTRLDLDGTEVSELSPLEGMPLRFLDISKTRTVDISPLRGLPLEDFHASGTALASLDGLQQMPLRRLDIGSTRITDLSLLAQVTSLEELNANGNMIEDLTALEGLPLRSLHLMGSKVANITPLKGLPLETLNLARTPVSDLTPLSGLPLRQLNLGLCRQIKDYTPLLKCSSLERLATSASASQLAPLRKHPRLTHIDYNDQGYRPVAEVWARLGIR